MDEIIAPIALNVVGYVENLLTLKAPRVGPGRQFF